MRIPAIAACTFAAALIAQPFRPEVPKVWDEKEIERFELPLVQRDRSPRHMSPEQYYALKVRPIYKTYPVYAPGREPKDYMDWLKQQEPEIIFDPAKLKTKEDCIRAGKIVFESEPLVLPMSADGSRITTDLPPDQNGILPAFLPFNSYIIRKKGVIEVGINSCAGCHTRVMPDGSWLSGAQGIVDLPISPDTLQRVRNATPEQLQRRRDNAWVMFGAPWITPRQAFDAELTREELIRRLAARRPGTFGRQGTSSSHPPHVPSLIGIQDIRYLDATGLVRHRSIGDLARYAVVNQGLDTLAHYGDFQPSAGTTPFSSEPGTRYSDEQLYALGLYLYSLQPPPNPNPMTSRRSAASGSFNNRAVPAATRRRYTPTTGLRPRLDLQCPRTSARPTKSSTSTSARIRRSQ